MSAPSFRVGEWRVHPDALELEGPGGTVPLEARPMAVLQELSRRPGETCTRQELLEAVWGERFVGDEVLTHCVWELRRVFGDRPKDPRYIQTIPRRGYRLIAPVAPLEPPAGRPRGLDRRLLVSGAVLAVILAALGALLHANLGPRSQRRVVVLPPDVRGSSGTGGGDLELAAAGLEAALVSGLARLREVTVVGPEALGDIRTAAAARALPVDELLVTEIAASQGTALIALRRMRASDGAVLWSGSFSAPLQPADGPLIVGAVAVQLRRAFEGLEWRRGTVAPDVSPADYALFLEIRRRIDRGAEIDVPEELAAAEEVVAGSPRFLDGHLLVGELARSLFTSGKARGALDRGLDAVETARLLAPDDPRVALLEARLRLEAGERGAALSAVAELERHAPGALQLPLLRARLARQEGRIEAAIEILAQAARRFPSWQNLYRLADLEAQGGRLQSARAHLEELLDRYPGSTWGLARLAELELLNGDLDRAERLYARLTEGPSPRPADLVNLGLAHWIQEEYPAAARAFQAALHRSPDRPAALLNLADTELALGNAEEGAELCRRLLEVVDRTTPSPAEKMFRAQCLAHLGDHDGAVATTLVALRKAPDDPEILYQAALVYALVGARASAVVSLRRAVEVGVQPRWLEIPPLRPLVAELRSSSAKAR